MAGVKGRSGRHTPKSLVNRSIAIIDKNLPDIFSALVHKAVVEHDREAQIYLIDRRLGKPKQSAEIDITGGQDIGANQLVMLLKLDSERKAVIDQYYLEHPEIVRPEWYTGSLPLQLPGSIIEIYEPKEG